MQAISRFKKISIAAAAIVSAALIPATSFAAPSPLNSNAPTVALNGTLSESLTVSATVATVNFTLVPGSTVNGSAAIPITTTWILLPSRTSVQLYGYFASSAAALTDGYTAPDNIPSSAVLGQVPTGTPTSYTAFSQTATGFGAASASLLLYTQAIALASHNFVGTRTDNLSLEIATPATLPAGTYTGTLTLQAQAI
jgi:hypothetical protein